MMTKLGALVSASAAMVLAGTFAVAAQESADITAVMVMNNSDDDTLTTLTVEGLSSLNSCYNQAWVHSEDGIGSKRFVTATCIENGETIAAIECKQRECTFIQPMRLD